MELSQRKRSEYLDLRRRYEPRSVKLVVIAESPPASGLYFYDPTGSPREPLFAALMKQLRLSPTTKEEGLREFQQSGSWLMQHMNRWTKSLVRGVTRSSTEITRCFVKISRH